MLSRSVNILFYFCLVIQNTGVQIVVKGTPREGHPLKEGLRPSANKPKTITMQAQRGSSTKRGIKTYIFHSKYLSVVPREGHPLKEGLRQVV
jgi:dUTPase